MVSVTLLYVVLVVAALAVAALVAAPLRRGAPRLFGAIVLLVPVMAFALYRIVGTPLALDAEAAAAAAARAAPTMEEAIAELEAALQRDPAQPEGWRLLARAYAAQGQAVKARDAFMSALEQIPDDPDLLIETAQARAQATPGNQFDDEALAQLRRALALDPANQRAQWFIGVVQRQRGEDAAAVATWEALLPALDAETASALRTQIDEARAAAGMPALAAQTPATAPTADPPPATPPPDHRSPPAPPRYTPAGSPHRRARSHPAKPPTDTHPHDHHAAAPKDNPAPAPRSPPPPPAPPPRPPHAAHATDPPPP